MVGTDPFTRVSVEAKPALYWPSLLKQSDVKWLAHTYKLTWTAAGTLSLKMKSNHCLFCCSVAGTEYRHWCWFLQPTTELFACLALSDDIVKHCCLTAGHTELHLRDERPPLRYLLSLRRGGRPMIMKGADSEQPVGAPCYQWVGCRDHAGLVCFPHSGSWQAQGGPVYRCRDQRKRVFQNMRPLIR